MKTHLIDDLLEEISRLQTSTATQVYPKGNFPSQRLHTTFSTYRREDDNIFFTVSIIYLLKSIKDYLSPKNKQIATDISENAME